MKYKIINPELINKSMFGKTEMIKQFIAIYLQQCPTDFQALEQSLLEQNIATIGDNAHHIKPTMEYIGASVLRKAFQDLESLCKSTTDMEQIQNKVREIKPLFQAMLSELEKYAVDIDEEAKDKG